MLQKDKKEGREGGRSGRQKEGRKERLWAKSGRPKHHGNCFVSKEHRPDGDGVRGSILDIMCREDGSWELLEPVGPPMQRRWMQAVDGARRTSDEVEMDAGS